MGYHLEACVPCGLIEHKGALSANKVFVRYKDLAENPEQYWPVTRATQGVSLRMGWGGGIDDDVEVIDCLGDQIA